MIISQSGEFSIHTGSCNMDIDYVHEYLSVKSYWAQKIPRSTVETSIMNSLCFGIFHGTSQIGFARMVTDKATFGYLADVFVDESFRGQGLSKWLMSVIFDHPDLQGFRRFMLGTKDAHGLYAQFGFTPLAEPARIMQRYNPDVYAKKEC